MAKLNKPAPAWGAPNDRGERWCGDPQGHGLRFVGYADKLVRLDHTGWYLDSEFLDETARGVVYLLPHGRYLAAMADPFNDGAALVDVSEVYDDDRDAAYTADHMAQRYAEAEREYQDGWRAGTEYADLGASVAELRRATLLLLAERRKYTNVGAAMWMAVRKAISDNLRTIEKARARRAALLDGYGNTDAFREGANL